MATKYLRRAAVLELVGLSTTTIYKMMSEGTFPRPIKLTGKAVAWPESAIVEWLESRPVSA